MVAWTAGQKYLFSSEGLTDEEKDIYYAWKKEIISEEEYCLYVDMEVYKDIKHKFPSKHNFEALEVDSHSQVKHQFFETFRKTNSFILIPDSILEEVFRSGEIR